MPWSGRYVAAGAAAVVLLGGAAAYTLLAARDTGDAEANDVARIATGRRLYDAHCASCHGRNLEGQPDWRRPLPSGELPAPPHDETGHTWHHPDDILFRITRNGGAAEAPPGFRSGMPAFAGVLSDDEVRAVLAYIKSRWPAPIRARQAEISGRSRSP